MLSLRSQTARRVLSYLFLNPDDDLYINEMVEKFGVDKRNLVKKLKRLTEEGVLVCASRGNLKLYSLNKKYPLLNEIKAIIAKTAGLEAELAKILKRIDGVEEAYIYGSYARNTMAASSDVDVFIVGSHNLIKLQGHLSRLQKRFGREINDVNIERSEYERRKKSKDPFLKEILGSKNIRIV